MNPKHIGVGAAIGAAIGYALGRPGVGAAVGAVGGHFGGPTVEDAIFGPADPVEAGSSATAQRMLGGLSRPAIDTEYVDLGINVSGINRQINAQIANALRRPVL